MGQILLLRHGQANLLGDDYDRLSERGCEQARIAGRHLAASGITPVLVVSGALKRQVDTARHAIAAAGWALEAEIDADFDEYHHVDLFTAAYPEMTDHGAIAARLAGEAEPRKAYQRLFETAFGAWLSGKTGAGGVSWSGFRERAQGALARVAARCGSGQTAVVVTSGGVIAAVVQGLLGLPDADVLKLHNPIYNASLTRLLNRGTEIGLSGFNDIAHLTVVDGGAMVTYR